MQHLSVPAIFLLACGISYVAAADPVLADRGSTDCQKHFAVQEKRSSGKTYTTWADFLGVTPSDALSKIFGSVAKDGWNVITADEGARVISASAIGSGKTAPVTVVVDVQANGSRAVATFRASAGETPNEDAIRSRMCGYLSAVTAT